MTGHCKQAVVGWTALAAYLAVALLPAGALVQCTSASDHSVIELAHGVCPESAGFDHSDRHGETLGSSNAACTDTPVLTVARHYRSTPIASLSLQPNTIAVIHSGLPICQLLAARALELLADPPGVRTVVLLV